jgi:hypothetical protein
MTNVLVQNINTVKVLASENNNSVVLKANNTNKNKIEVLDNSSDTKSVTVAKQAAIKVTSQIITPGGSGIVQEPDLDGGLF